MTIKDIARESGYAVGTVSRVLNNHPNVSKKAREKIMAVVTANNFELNTNAKQLKQHSSGQIVIIIKGMRNQLFARLVELMQAGLAQRGHSSSVSYIDEDANEIAHALRIVREEKPLGIAFLGGNRSFFEEEFSRVTTPCVLVTNSAEGLGFSNLSSVTTDDALGAASAVAILSERGHRNIGVLGGNLAISFTSRDRCAGVERAMADMGQPFDIHCHYEAARFSLPDGYAAALRLLDKYPGLTAIFAMSDIMAIGAMRALRDRGIAVPGEVSIVGFDGIELSRYSSPRLTTIRQDAEEISGRAVEILLAAVETGDGAVHEIIPFEVLEGESVAYARAISEEGA